ncbi:12996_t:CDS:2, partial [Racocetra fulgida]
MLSYQIITKNPSAELIEMEKYIRFDNTAECSVQASPNNYYDNYIENNEGVLANIDSGVVVTSENIPG